MNCLFQRHLEFLMTVKMTFDQKNNVNNVNTHALYNYIITLTFSTQISVELTNIKTYSYFQHHVRKSSFKATKIAKCYENMRSYGQIFEVCFFILL